MRKFFALKPGLGSKTAIWTRLAPGLFLLLCAALLFSQCSAPQRNIPLTRLSSEFQPLRAEFNQDAGKVRLLLLVDPT